MYIWGVSTLHSAPTWEFSTISQWLPTPAWRCSTAILGILHPDLEILHRSLRMFHTTMGISPPQHEDSVLNIGNSPLQGFIYTTLKFHLTILGFLHTRLGLIMPLDQLQPPSPSGTVLPPKDQCSTIALCILVLLSEIGKHYHSFRCHAPNVFGTVDMEKVSQWN